jgi:menaquinone-dependent protoporphyrinogen oxidase
MKALVVYASKYGSTKGIAEFISEKLRRRGMLAEIQPVEAVHDLGGYDVFVIGSATYMGHWLKEATEFVKRNRVVLAELPVWLFSSGPLVIENMDAQSRDLGDTVPKEVSEFSELIHPRDHRVFFGKLDGSKLTIVHRMMATLPAARAIFREGDFRDWKNIEAWVISIAQALESLLIQSDVQT